MMLRILTVLFLAQLALVASLYWPESYEETRRVALVTTVHPDTVNRIQLSTDEGATVVLLRDDNEWNLDLGLPADNSKVRSLLNALLEADPGFPVADSETAAKRFEVSDGGFERKITLSSVDGDATVFLGSTPALRKIHARVKEETAVYVLPLSSFDAPADIDSWLDTRLIAREPPAEFSLYGVDFVLSAGVWSRGDGEEANQATIAALAEVIGSIQISGLVDPADDEAAGADEALRVSLVREGESSQLLLLHNPQSDRYYFDSERPGGLFSTSAYDAERLIDAAKALFEGALR